MTKRRFDSMLPIKDACTMTISGGCATSAMIETISSTALLRDNKPMHLNSPYTVYPKVALSRPPMVSPVRRAISSVAYDSSAASGTIAMKLTTKTTTGLTLA